jgi:FkbM family methyltransferase
MFKKLEKLKNKNYTPQIIFDIGAYQGVWTDNMLNIYHNCDYYLFEAILYAKLDKFNDSHNIFVHKGVILSDKQKVVNWYEGLNTGDSIHKEKSIFYKDTKPIIKSAIDLNSYISTNNLLKNKTLSNIFIKIDCQGSEIDILKGSTNILPYTDFILIEMPFFGKYNENIPNFKEHIDYLDSIGFIPYDILESHYINGYNMQIDILFINKNHNLNQQVQYDLTQKLQVE